MSFLKITDPKKRDSIVKEFLETKKNIQESQLRERAGKRELKKDLGKFFKPVTDVQKETVEEIKEELRPLKEIAPAIAAIPGPVVLPALPEPIPDIDRSEIGKISLEYLDNFGSKSGTDTTFGLYSKDKKFYIGDKPVDFIGEYIVVDEKGYKGTAGLWELITAKVPDKRKITDKDKEKYEKIMDITNAIYQDNNPKTGRPKASKSYKYNEYIKPVWDNIKEKSGKGLSDPNKLIERLDILVESKKAGNTDVDQEIVSICDNLKKQNILNSKEHEKILKI